MNEIKKAIKVEDSSRTVRFCYCLLGKEITETNKSPRDFNNIELICSNYTNNFDIPKGTVNTKNLEHFDLMFAYKDDRNKGLLYLGHFNDGII